MDGFEVMKLKQAIKKADVLVTVTGNKHVVDEEHLANAKHGLILANSGHFDVEINKTALKKMSKKVAEVRPFVEEYDMGGKSIYLLAQGRLVNLASAEGHPASVMDMSFAGQALSCEFIWKNRGTLTHDGHQLPESLDYEIARLKLKAEGIAIDSLTANQKKYLSSWKEGT